MVGTDSKGEGCRTSTNIDSEEALLGEGLDLRGSESIVFWMGDELRDALDVSVYCTEFELLVGDTSNGDVAEAWETTSPEDDDIEDNAEELFTLSDRVSRLLPAISDMTTLGGGNLSLAWLEDEVRGCVLIPNNSVDPEPILPLLP